MTVHHLPLPTQHLLSAQAMVCLIHRTERTKSGKRSSVSWQISKTPPDGASIAEDGGEDVITLVEQENLKESNSNRANTPTDRPKSGIISKPKR